jgi:hypothetical protein
MQFHESRVPQAGVPAKRFLLRGVEIPGVGTWDSTPPQFSLFPFSHKKEVSS